MARRKRVLDDSDSDSSPGRSDDDFGNDPDLRDERELFQDSYNANAGERTTRTIYGVFGDDKDSSKRGSTSLHLLACFQTKRMIMEKRKYRCLVLEV